MNELNDGLVHVRTPTYKRPEALARCMRKLQAQSWSNWICTIYDDDPQRAGEAVCRAFDDPRVQYVGNDPQRFASKNIDACFSTENPHNADYFCVVEDDNYILERFMEDNIEILRDTGVRLLLRNQVIEHGAGTPNAKLGNTGVLDGLFREGLYAPELFRLALMLGIGVSNGGLFWSRSARSDLEIGYACTATLQEYLRTFAVVEPIYVAMEPLAVWAENAEQTTRNAELRAGYLRRELDLKKSVQKLQRVVWEDTAADVRRDFLTNPAFKPGAQQRAKSVAKALPLHPLGRILPARERMELTLRGWAIGALGRGTGDLDAFIASRRRLQPEAEAAV